MFIYISSMFNTKLNTVHNDSYLWITRNLINHREPLRNWLTIFIPLHRQQHYYFCYFFGLRIVGCCVFKLCADADLRIKGNLNFNFHEIIFISDKGKNDKKFIYRCQILYTIKSRLHHILLQYVNLPTINPKTVIKTLRTSWKPTLQCYKSRKK